MSTKQNLLVMFAAVAGMTQLLPAQADELVTRTFVTPSQVMQVVPQPVVIPTTTTSYIAPAQTVKTTRTTVTTSAPALCPAPVAPLAALPTETVRRTVIMSAPAAAAPSSSMVTEAEVGPFPVYSNRLSAMNEQIDRACANSWITRYQADNLRIESNRLSQMIMNRSTALADVDTLEKGLTGLNLDIQSAMQTNGHTAGLIQPTY